MQERTKLALNSFGVGLAISYALLALRDGNKFGVVVAVFIMMMQVSFGALAYKRVKDSNGYHNIFRGE